MQSMDLNLLPVAHALLSERSVTRAAAAVNLSVPAVSRALDRCRRTFADPLLVRRGRGLVITPRGEALLAALGPVLDEIARLSPGRDAFDPSDLRASFLVRANEVVIATVGAALHSLVRQEAPGVTLRFALEAEDDIEALGRGDAALAIGSYSQPTAEVCSTFLGRETLVGIVGRHHPLAAPRVTLKRFAAADHIVTSRRGIESGPIDEALSAAGLRRNVVAIVPSFTAAAAMCVRADVTTVVPRRLAELLAGPAGLHVFTPPMALPTVEVRVYWHQRVDADPAHRWLVECCRRAVVPSIEAPGAAATRGSSRTRSH
jgi:DNA-binding transcriptional LysR family regulator